ncbi:hypothetical protein AMTR_s00017p00114750 [Amborella trichopoda]|uniref:Uncharacterized protein n=1 Tax=Amborella trichopoda TaxID=13333 RepID=W1PLB7_AMBTC|nr:hypothetical protein AMTR_s00017p00114750 [Amborella trichopoda]
MSEKDIVYLASYLALFLCTFALSVLRPGCFYVACRLAQGAIALGKATTKDNKTEPFGGEVRPGRFRTSFPVHYIFGWLSAYFPGANEIKNDLTGFACPHMLKIAGMKTIFRGPV